MKFLSDRGKSLFMPMGLILALGGCCYWFYDSWYGTGLIYYKLELVERGKETWLESESVGTLVDGDIKKYAIVDPYIFGYKASRYRPAPVNPKRFESPYAVEDFVPEGYFVVTKGTHTVTAGLDKAAFERELREKYNLDPDKIRFKDVD